METARDVNKYQQNNYQYNNEYLLHFKNLPSLQNDKPIDLTNANSSSGRNGCSFEFRGRAWAPSPSNPEFQNTDNQAEVMKAAKSLFSKKTRTLYHWMYPNTPKFQLKSAVTMAWDTMGMQEKQFYISQVLGKFGYLQSSLMVNPQLGCMSLPIVPQMDTNQPDMSNVETRNAVSNLLRDSNNSWPQLQSQPSKKRGRPRGSKRSEKHFKSRRSHRFARSNEEDDFTDDPELRKELEQFQWALHLVEK